VHEDQDSEEQGLSHGAADESRYEVPGPAPSLGDLATAPERNVTTIRDFSKVGKPQVARVAVHLVTFD
jgi:hypothetical protein